MAATTVETMVVSNRVFRASVNIFVGQALLPAAPAIGVTARTNTAQSGYYGIVVTGAWNLVEGNQARTNVVGIHAASASTDNLIRSNDARYNHDVDCDDDTADEVADVANTWSDNRAFVDDPVGICTVP